MTDLPGLAAPDRGISARATLHSPIVCRCAGLPYGQIETIGVAGTRDPSMPSGLIEQRDRLWALLDDPLFVDCLATQTPSALQTYVRRRHEAVAGRRTSYYRGLDRGLYRFATRFTTRNDTTGTAGSTFWGTFQPDDAESLSFQAGALSHASRVVYPSPRHAQALIVSLAHGPLKRSSLVRLGPRYRLMDSDVMDIATRTFMPVSPGERAVLQRCRNEWVPWADAAVIATEAVLDGLLDRDLVDLTLAAPWHPDLDGRLRHARHALDSATDACGTAAADGVDRLIAFAERLRHVRGVEYASLIRDAEAAAVAMIHHDVDTVEAGRSVLRWIFLKARNTTIPLSLSQIHYLTPAGQLFDRRSGTVSPVSALFQEQLRISCTSGTPICLDDVPLEPHRRDEVWQLVQRGALAIGGLDLGGVSALESEELMRRCLSEVLRVAVLPESIGVIVGLVANMPISMGRRLQARSAIAVRLDAAGIEAPTPRVDREFFISDSARHVERFAIGGALHAAMTTAVERAIMVFGFGEYVRDRRVVDALSAYLPTGRRVALVTARRILFDRGLAGRNPLAVNLRTPPFADRVDDVARTLRVRTHYDRGSHTVHIESVQYPPGFERWLVDKRLVSNVDLMLRPNADTGPRLILNEVHRAGAGLPETTQFPLIQPADQRAKCGGQSHVDRIFGQRLLVSPMEVTKQADGILWQLAGATVGAETAPWPWVDPSSRLLPMSEVDIARLDDGFVVMDAAGDRYRFVSAFLSVGDLRVVGDSQAWLADALLSLVDTTGMRSAAVGQRTPAIQMGDLLIARASVSVRCGDRLRAMHRLNDGALLAEGERLRRDLMLPRWTFVSLAGQKTFYCDLESVFSLEVLAHELRAYDGVIRFVEMVPGPSDLWVDFGAGCHTAEMRFVATVDGAGFTGTGDVLKVHGT